jgi:hypothetical protein
VASCHFLGFSKCRSLVDKILKPIQLMLALWTSRRTLSICERTSCPFTRSALLSFYIMALHPRHAWGADLSREANLGPALIYVGDCLLGIIPFIA